MFHKLAYYSIRGNLLDWIKHFILQRSQCVVIKGQQSSSAAVTSGVPQGTVLAPLLFLCFINDLPNGILSKIKLYADDVLLYNTIHTQQDCEQLQKIQTCLETGLISGRWYLIIINVNSLEELTRNTQHFISTTFKRRKLKRSLMLNI